MKTVIKEITPEWAKKILETRNPRNRNISPTFVEKLARDIRCGAFATTHQGIAFDENGDLLDGQHRLSAVVLAGKPITIPVTTGIPCSVKLNGGSVNTFELIDAGKVRSTGAMLQMAGFVNGNSVAAATRISVLVAARNTTSIGLSTAQIRKALMYIQKSVEACVSTGRSARIITPQSYVTGTVALYHTVAPDLALEFLSEVGDVSGSAGSPSRAFAAWTRNRAISGGSGTLAATKVVASALWHASQGNKISKIYPNDAAMEWLLSLNKPLFAKLAAIISD